MAEMTLDLARQMCDAAVARAKDQGIRVSVVVLDAGGHIVAVVRMDGCNYLSPDIARGKAYAAAAWKQASADLRERWQDSAAVVAGMVGISGGRIVPVQGALPIFDGQCCLGAIGASGARSDEDEDAVRAGVEAVGLATKPA